MKILLVNKLYAPDRVGGAEIIVADLAAGMIRRGHDVRVVTTTAQDHPVEEVIDDVPVTRLPLQNVFWHNAPARASAWQRMRWHARDIHNASMGEALAGVIRTFDPDVVEFHNLSGFSKSAWDAAIEERKPTVQVLHDYYNLCPRSHLYRDGENCTRPCAVCRVFRLGHAQSSNRLSAVIGVSEAVLDAHVDSGLFSDVKMRSVINNARPFGGAAPRTHAATATTFGFIGQLSEWKGIAFLCEAFSRLAADSSLPPLRLLVAGNGEQRYLKELKQAYGDRPIEFLGPIPVQAFFERVDVLVVPSIWRDPLPTVIIEALLHGVPVIGSRRGGIPEMVVDGVNGLLFDPARRQELDRCMRRFVSEDGLLARLGHQARAGAARFGDMERVIDEHVAVCEAAMAA